MGKIAFLLPESKRVWQHLETAAARSHHDAPRAFEDFLTMTVCALSGGQMEEKYLAVADQYGAGEKPRRAVDAFPKAMAALIDIVEKTRQDILGDIFQGAISRGRNGQFFTPENVCDLMAQMLADTEARVVLDPCCGSGRNLLAAGKVNPRATFYGQDIDLRCVQMTAINLALHNLYGYVIHGDSLTCERRLIYQTGLSDKGAIAEIAPEHCPLSIKAIMAEVRTAGTQLTLF